MNDKKANYRMSKGQSALDRSTEAQRIWTQLKYSC